MADGALAGSTTAASGVEGVAASGAAPVLAAMTLSASDFPAVATKVGSGADDTAAASSASGTMPGRKGSSSLGAGAEAFSEGALASELASGAAGAASGFVSGLDGTASGSVMAGPARFVAT